MRLIKDSDMPAIRERLSAMTSATTLTFFTQEIECDLCRETRELLEELSGMDERLTLQIYDFAKDLDEVARFGIDKIPATVVASSEDYGIRFYGIPAGYEFASLLDAIVMVSKGESNLSSESRSLLKAISTPVHLQVFVTPT